MEEAKVVWYNKSLAYVSCDNPNIKWVTNQMLLPDGKVRPRFVQHFEQFLQVSLRPVGQVLGYFLAVEASASPEMAFIIESHLF